MKKEHFIAMIAGCILALPAMNSKASDQITYQGKLTDAASVPLPDGIYRIGVRIWDTASGGTTPLLARKYNVPVQNGVFSMMIGGTGDGALAWTPTPAYPAPLTPSIKLALSGTSRYLETIVMSDAGQVEKAENEWKVLAPRQTLGAVPYAMNGVPPGTVVPFAGIVVPEGWLLCNGASYSTTDQRFSALFAAIQTTYGSGTGTFRVPDLRGRVAVGAGQGDTRGSDPAAPTNWVRGVKFGTESRALLVQNLPDHLHGISLTTASSGNHNHGFSIGRGDSGSRNMPADGDADGGSKTVYTNMAGIHNHTLTGDTLGDRLNYDLMQSKYFDIHQPSLVLNYIIKL